MPVTNRKNTSLVVSGIAFTIVALLFYFLYYPIMNEYNEIKKNNSTASTFTIENNPEFYQNLKTKSDPLKGFVDLTDFDKLMTELNFPKGCVGLTHLLLHKMPNWNWINMKKNKQELSRVTAISALSPISKDKKIYANQNSNGEVIAFIIIINDNLLNDYWYENEILHTQLRGFKKLK